YDSGGGQSRRADEYQQNHVRKRGRAGHRMLPRVRTHPMSTARGTILVVEDEEKILKAIGRALRDAGYDVVDTASPKQAQRLLTERTFDLFLVDNVMPEISGLELIREYVGSTPESERAQILMMTAHATVESALEAMKLGAVDCLQKPFDLDELLAVVRR